MKTCDGWDVFVRKGLLRLRHPRYGDFAYNLTIIPLPEALRLAQQAIDRGVAMVERQQNTRRG